MARRSRTRLDSSFDEGDPMLLSNYCRRAVVVGLSSTVLAMFVLALSAGSANATAAYCRTDGTPGDATVDLPGVVFAQLDSGMTTSPTQAGFWLCVIPPEQGVGVGIRDLNPSEPGFQVGAESCGT